MENVNLTQTEKFQCASCKHTWEEKNCVKEHIIQSTRIFFCLNCDDWVRDKAAVFNKGWSLFDRAGFLRPDI